MTDPNRITLVCSCEGTMPLDEAALAQGCGGTLRTATQACRGELDLVRRLAATGAPITVGCTQEAPLFREVAEELGAAERLSTVNLREAAGWSDEAERAGPKMAALLAAAAEPQPPISLVTLESRGVALILGRDEAAIEVGRRLAEHLDVTVLLDRPGEVAPPRAAEFPIARGTARRAKGHLGAFELSIDGYALPLPSSRRALVFGPIRDGAISTSDLVLDLTGSPPLFPAHELRPGYLRADPRDPAQVERLVFEASHLVGTFDKPRYIAFDAGLCAHSRSKITGCTRCLDLCPTGAIAPAGDAVAIDPAVCAGCGSCAAACPTGAAAYALPPADALMRRLRTLLLAYAEAGGTRPVVLFHDGDHGEPLIEALARFGRGLPANVLPLRVNEVTQVGPETLAAAFAFGASGVTLLVRGRPKHDPAGINAVTATANLILDGLGYGRGVSVVETDDPDLLRERLDALTPATASAEPSRFMPTGAKRGVLKLAMTELHRVAPAPVAAVALPAGAPFGGLEVRSEGCTLCLSCVSACPTHALGDGADRPTLTFDESLCVQCGLCAATCPEDVIELRPRLDFAAWEAPRRVIKEEEPFHCVACAKPFGTRASVERVTRALADKHWMFAGPQGQQRLRVIQMCEDCRVEAVMNESFDPHGAAARPATRTTEDYLRERAADGTA